MTKEELELVIENLENWLLFQIKYGSTEEEDIYKEVHEKLLELKKHKGAD